MSHVTLRQGVTSLVFNVCMDPLFAKSMKRRPWCLEINPIPPLSSLEEVVIILKNGGVHEDDIGRAYIDRFYEVDALDWEGLLDMLAFDIAQMVHRVRFHIVGLEPIVISDDAFLSSQTVEGYIVKRVLDFIRTWTSMDTVDLSHANISYSDITAWRSRSSPQIHNAIAHGIHFVSFNDYRQSIDPHRFALQTRWHLCPLYVSLDFYDRFYHR